jgi:hypothetical protein
LPALVARRDGLAVFDDLDFRCSFGECFGGQGIGEVGGGDDGDAVLVRGPGGELQHPGAAGRAEQAVAEGGPRQVAQQHCHHEEAEDDQAHELADAEVQAEGQDHDPRPRPRPDEEREPEFDEDCVGDAGSRDRRERVQGGPGGAPAASPHCSFRDCLSIRRRGRAVVPRPPAFPSRSAGTV